MPVLSAGMKLSQVSAELVANTLHAAIEAFGLLVKQVSYCTPAQFR